MIWQLHLPWQKAQHSWKIQEFLDFLPQPRKMSAPYAPPLASQVILMVTVENSHLVLEATSL